MKSSIIAWTENSTFVLCLAVLFGLFVRNGHIKCQSAVRCNAVSLSRQTYCYLNSSQTQTPCKLSPPVTNVTCKLRLSYSNIQLPSCCHTLANSDRSQGFRNEAAAEILTAKYVTNLILQHCRYLPSISIGTAVRENCF